MDILVFGSREYFSFLALLLSARLMDFVSTWVATPRLVLEANPLAKWMGWKWGGVVNAVLCVAFAVWPLPTIVIATTSVLVAARNFQSAWLMRSMGEGEYSRWIAERLSHSSLETFVLCLLAQSFLFAAIGVALMIFSPKDLVPFGIGMGMIAYAMAVTFYSLLSLRRLRR